MAAETVILGIDPGLAHTGWGLVLQRGSRLSCMAYGCIETKNDKPLPQRLQKIYQQMSAVVARYQPSCVGVETVWFGSNAQSAFATTGVGNFAYAGVLGRLSGLSFIPVWNVGLHPLRLPVVAAADTLSAPAGSILVRDTAWPLRPALSCYDMLSSSIGCCWIVSRG